MIPGYSKLAQRDTLLGTITAYQSNSSIDQQWDAFLDATPLGHYEQTSMWAELKYLEGWQSYRVIFTLNGSIIGGFQILAQRIYCGNFGYITKGPVFESAPIEVMSFYFDILKFFTKRKKLKTLVVVPPQDRQDISIYMRQNGFFRNYLKSFSQTANCMIDLKKKTEEIFQGLKRQKRQNIRTGRQKGVIVHEGDKKDLNLFYQLMMNSCKRQDVDPDPASEKIIKAAWDLFAPTNRTKLFFARYNDEVTSGLLTLLFGKTLYFWKFGWSGKHGRCRPNEVLYWKVIKWAKSHGFDNVNMLYVNPKALGDKFLTDANDTEKGISYSNFKLGFGGQAILLPEANIYIYNPLLRYIYSFFAPLRNYIRFPKQSS